MINFNIKREHLRAIHKNKIEYVCPPDREPTSDETLRILKHGNIKSSVMWEEESPEFTKLREHLGNEGYIEIERGWYNGDSVLRPFTLNNSMTFLVGDQFPCAVALLVRFENQA